MSVDFHKNPYAATRNMTASPIKHVSILLYRAAQHIEKSKEYFQNNQVYERYMEIDKSMAILSGLAESLNIDDQQDNQVQFLIQEMLSFYTKTLRSLMELNASGNFELADQVIEQIQQMAQVWSSHGSI